MEATVHQCPSLGLGRSSAFLGRLPPPQGKVWASLLEDESPPGPAWVSPAVSAEASGPRQRSAKARKAQPSLTADTRQNLAENQTTTQLSQATLPACRIVTLRKAAV